MSIDFHRLIEAIDNNRLIVIDYIDYIRCLSVTDFHRLGTPLLRKPGKDRGHRVVKQVSKISEVD